MAITENDIPIAIKKKLNQIYTHQIKANVLAHEVEEFFLDKYPQIDIPNLDGWTWRMHVDQQGQPLEPRASLKLLIKALSDDNAFLVWSEYNKQDIKVTRNIKG